MVDLYQSVGGRTGVGYYLIVLWFCLLVILSFLLSCPLSLL